MSEVKTYTRQEVSRFSFGVQPFVQMKDYEKLLTENKLLKTRVYNLEQGVRHLAK